MSYKNKKYLRLARGKPCVKCGSLDGVVAAHYSGMGAHLLGKGTAKKTHDYCVAWLCHTCHTEMDNYTCHNDVTRSADFLMYVLLSMGVVLETEELKLETDKNDK